MSSTRSRKKKKKRKPTPESLNSFCLVLAASFAFRRNSVLLAAYPGPSSLSSSPRARTTFLTPTPIICLRTQRDSAGRRGA